MIVRFPDVRLGWLMCSHVHRPPCVHMGAHQLTLTNRQNLGISTIIGIHPVGPPLSHVRTASALVPACIGVRDPLPAAPGHKTERHECFDLRNRLASQTDIINLDCCLAIDGQVVPAHLINSAATRGLVAQLPPTLALSGFDEGWARGYRLRNSLGTR